MSENDTRKALGKLINSYLTGEIHLDQVEEKFPVDIEKCDDPAILHAFHALQHFEGDSDIREKDKEYSRIQENELREFVVSLNRSEDLETHTAHFLRPRRFFLSKIADFLKSFKN